MLADSALCAPGSSDAIAQQSHRTPADISLHAPPCIAQRSAGHLNVFRVFVRVHVSRLGAQYVRVLVHNALPAKDDPPQRA